MRNVTKFPKKYPYKDPVRGWLMDEFDPGGITDAQKFIHPLQVGEKPRPLIDAMPIKLNKYQENFQGIVEPVVSSDINNE